MIDEQFNSISKIFDEIEKMQVDTFKQLEVHTLLLQKLMKSKNKKNQIVEKKKMEQQKKRDKFKCYFCGEFQEDQEQLNHHYLQAHQIKALYYGPDKFTCRICFKEFKGVMNLLLHEKNIKHDKKYVLFRDNQM